MPKKKEVKKPEPKKVEKGANQDKEGNTDLTPPQKIG